MMVIYKTSRLTNILDWQADYLNLKCFVKLMFLTFIHHVLLTGSNCSEYIQSQEFALWRLPFHCEVTMTTSHPHITVDDLVKVVNAFDSQSGMFQLSYTVY